MTTTSKTQTQMDLASAKEALKALRAQTSQVLANVKALKVAAATERASMKEAKAKAKTEKAAARAEKKAARVAKLEAKLAALKNPVGTAARKAAKRPSKAIVAKR